MALGEDVPVDAPLVSVPVAGLSGGLCGAVDAVVQLVLPLGGCLENKSFVPDSSGLEVCGCARKDSGGSVKARLGAVHDPLGNW